MKSITLDIGTIEFEYAYYLSPLEICFVLSEFKSFGVHADKKNDWNIVTGSNIFIRPEKPTDFHYWVGAEDETGEWILNESKQNESLMKSQILDLESQITPRRLREAALGDSDSISFISDIDNQISILRTQLPQP